MDVLESIGHGSVASQSRQNSDRTKLSGDRCPAIQRPWICCEQNPTKLTGHGCPRIHRPWICCEPIPTKFRSDKIEWGSLSGNPAAMDLLRAKPNKINWAWMSSNPSAMDLLRANPDKIQIGQN